MIKYITQISLEVKKLMRIRLIKRHAEKTGILLLKSDSSENRESERLCTNNQEDEFTNDDTKQHVLSHCSIGNMGMSQLM